MVEGLAQRDNLMDYRSDMDDRETLKVNPYAIVKSTTMIIPTPSKVEITGKRSHSEVVKVEDEDSEAHKRKKTESEGEVFEDESKKKKEKGQIPSL